MSKRALCIGINDYPGTSSDLAGCVNDANDWASVLSQRGFTVTKLLNKKATGAGIRQAIKALIQGAQKGDSVIIQYSGHGSFVPDKDGDEPDGTDECLCPYDISTKGPITDDELFTLYSDRKPGVKLIIISDSCHSGTVARFAPITTPPTVKGKHAPQRKVRFLPPGAFVSKKKMAELGVRRSIRRSTPPGRYAGLLMAGCQDTEYSYDAYFQADLTARSRSWHYGNSRSSPPRRTTGRGLRRSVRHFPRSSTLNRRTYTDLPPRRNGNYYREINDPRVYSSDVLEGVKTFR